MDLITEIKLYSILYRRAKLYERIMEVRREKSRLTQIESVGENLNIRSSGLNGLLAEYRVSYKLLCFELAELVGRAERNKNKEKELQTNGVS